MLSMSSQTPSNASKVTKMGFERATKEPTPPFISPSKVIKFQPVDPTLLAEILAGKKQPKGFWRKQPRLMRPRHPVVRYR